LFFTSTDDTVNIQYQKSRTINHTTANRIITINPRTSKKGVSKMTENNNIQHLVEEYKTLRHEIDQNQRDNFNYLQLGLVLTGTLLGLAYSDFVKDQRWILVFIPCFILMPVSMLVAQRTRNTWIIGRYIEGFIEPQLGYKWEFVNYKRKTEAKKSGKVGGITSFVGSSMSSLIIIQILCPLLSLLALEKQEYIIYWLPLAISVLIMIIFQIKAIIDTNHPDQYAAETLKFAQEAGVAAQKDSKSNPSPTSREFQISLKCQHLDKK